MTEIRWAKLAQNDVSRIHRYYRDEGVDIAIEIVERIVSATRILSDLPQAGPLTLRGDRRKWRVPGTRYMLFYRLERDHVRILRVLHGAQHQASKQ